MSQITHIKSLGSFKKQNNQLSQTNLCSSILFSKRGTCFSSLNDTTHLQKSEHPCFFFIQVCVQLKLFLLGANDNYEILIFKHTLDEEVDGLGIH